jgi:hypothetical protein
MTASVNSFCSKAARFSLLFLLFASGVQAVEPSTKVYHQAGKNRVHLAECPRYSKADPSLFTEMTMAEAEAKGLVLCSRCPGSTTTKNPSKGKTAAAAAGKPATATAASLTANDLTPDTIVYFSGKKRVHLQGCPRYKSADPSSFTTMTWAEAQAKGLSLCSRCPGSTTGK